MMSLTLSSRASVLGPHVAVASGSKARRFLVTASFKRDGEENRPSPLSPAFTRPREYAVGRVAMIGVAAAWAGEVLTGMGPVSQLSWELGVSQTVAYGLLAALAAWQGFVGLARTNTAAAYGARPATAEPAPFKYELLLGRAAMLSELYCGGIHTANALA